MSKGKGGGDNNYQNRAAKRFKQLDNIATMSQEEIFEIFEQDFDTIVEQVNEKGKFPQYLLNAFANISTPLWFKEYIDDHVKVKKKAKIKTDLDNEAMYALKEILSRAYKKSATNFYEKQGQEFEDRNKLISKSFIKLEPKLYMLSGKLSTKENKISELKRRDLCIQVYGNPVHNMKFVFGIFDQSSVSDKKKLKIFQKMYGDRFETAVGAALTVNNTKSDFLALIYEFVMRGCYKNKWSKKKKLKARAPFIHAYAKVYKWNQSSYFKLKEGDFYKKNRVLIKQLKEKDRGFKKAFKNLKGKTIEDNKGARKK